MEGLPRLGSRAGELQPDGHLAVDTRLSREEPGTAKRLIESHFDRERLSRPDHPPEASLILTRDHRHPAFGNVAGRSEATFSPEAVELISQYSGGLPRRLNHICDLCLVLSYSRRVEWGDEEMTYRIILDEEDSRV